MIRRCGGYLLAAVATVLLAAMRIALWLIPYQRLSHWLSGIGVTGAGIDPAASCHRTTRALTLAARIVPGSTCLPQAVAGKILLAAMGQPSKIHIGAAKLDDGTLHAHAWLECHGRIVTGASSDLERYTLVLAE